MKNALAVFITMTLILASCSRAPSSPTETRIAQPSATSRPGVTAQADAPPGSRLAGSHVTILTSLPPDQLSLFQKQLASLLAVTGIDVSIENAQAFETQALARSEAGDPYDLLLFPHPSLMIKMGRRGYLVDIGRFITTSEMREAYPQTWIDAGTVDGQPFGVLHGAEVKSLVWYPRPAFEAAGYRVPETWHDLLALSDQIVADGGVPWCISLENDQPDGGPGTDWIEDIMLRTTPASSYDAWTLGELSFDSPELRNAFSVLERIWQEPEYVFGGSTRILTSTQADARLPLLNDPPGCFLYRHAAAEAGDLPEGKKIGTDVAYFYLPPIDSAFGRPVLGSGTFIGLSKDTPAGRQVIKFMLTAASVEAEVKAGELLSPINGVPPSWYPSDTQRSLAEILRSADPFRIDGSVLMPDLVGTGSFPAGVRAFVRGEALEVVLQSIDSGWPRP